MTATPPDTFTPVAPPDASVLAQALGLPLYAPDWHMPQYPEGAVGPWRMRRTGVGLDCGYYSGTCISAGSTVLLRQGSEGQWDTWMSLSPMEIESQELACRHARGHTVVMGLGMGWVAANVALQPAVARVTVVERDGDVLELLLRCRVLEGLPEFAARKIELVQSDALQWQPGGPIDFLYADIWLKLAEPRALADVQRMQAHVQAAQVYFWGQEVVVGNMAAKQAEPGAPEWADAVAQAVRDTGLPLLAEAPEGYATFVAQVLALRKRRQVAAD
jgi:hypothetical protein